MKLAMRPRKSPIGARDGANVAHRKQRQLFGAREERHAERRAEEAAMKGHASFPEHQGFERMAKEVLRVINQHVPESSANDDAESHVDDEIVDADRRRPRLILVPE